MSGLAPCGKTGIRFWKVTRLRSKELRGGGVVGHADGWSGKSGNIETSVGLLGVEAREFERIDVFLRRTGPVAGTECAECEKSSFRGICERSAISCSTHGGASRAGIHES